MKRAGVLLYLPSLFVLAVCGCESVPEGQLPVAPVEVTVNYKGQPVEEAVVTFASSEGKPPAFGRTDAQGIARMTTYKTEDGAVLGTHSVSVVKQEFDGVIKEEASQDSEDYNPSPGASPLPKVKDLLPKKYSLPTTSGLTVDVKSGENKVTLDLVD
ncbi:MAG: hypothetical protein ACTHOU_17265 [Aureliella sp.]